MTIPFFLRTTSGRLFTLLHLPDTTEIPKEWVVHIPAFAEEMNKTRPMVARQAKALAEEGFGVLIFDFYGTGDSEGDFGDADWTKWQSDIISVCHWIVDHGGENITLWGIRTGCLLALEASRQLTSVVSHLLFWQPVVSGQQAINQFLRLRVAAGMMNDQKETVAELLGLLKKGNRVEVAGYDLSSALVDQMGKRNFEPDSPAAQGIDWIEIVSNPEKPLMPVSRRIVDGWLEVKGDIHTATVQGDAFWATQEITLAPDLIQATTATMKRRRGGIGGSANKNKIHSLIEHQIGRLSNDQEKPVTFRCDESELVGILHAPDQEAERGVLLIVGGPQYRVGSHRQFVLLARSLSNAGIPVFRFDYRGMGDSDGPELNFEEIDHDISSAIDSMQQELPRLREIIIWGLCDAATAASFYAHFDKRVCGLVLLNPWVRSEESLAKAHLKHYYWKRIFAAAFWRKLFEGRLDFGKMLISLFNNLRMMGGGTVNSNDSDPKNKQALIPLFQRMLTGLEGYTGRILFILSGNDLTAAEFKDSVKSSRHFSKLMAGKNVSWKDLEPADHTFSRRVWRDQVARWTQEWIQADKERQQ